MTSVSDSHSHMQPALQIDRVEWLSASPDSVLVRVLGRRHGRLGDDPPVLLVRDGEDRRAFPAAAPEPQVPDEGIPEADNAAWIASFPVPIELRPRLEEGLALQLGALQVELPPAVPGAEPGAEAAPSPGLVIDREVLAERRARRAELNEQALMGRASAAEATIRTLRSQLGNLEQRLEQTAAEREKLTEALAARERELRRAKQREYAEEQLRFEAEDRRRAAEQQATAGVAELRQLLHEAEREIQHLNGELEDVRRQLAEVHHAAEADQASLRRLRRELEERQTELVRREAELTQQEQHTTASVTEVQTARAEIQRQRAELDERARALEAQLAEVQRDLAAEAARREQLEHELAVRPEPGSDERADALQAELERRAHLQAQVAGELSLLQGELEQVRASAEYQRERNDEADRLLEELGRTIGGLRVELEALERDKNSAEAAAERLRGEVAELVRALELARTEPRRDDSELARLHEQVQLRDQQLREAERTIHALSQSAAELRTELQAERERHARDAAELRARIEEERQASEQRLAGAEARMREQLSAQGQRLVSQSDSSQETIERLDAELRETGERLAQREQELADARAVEQAARADSAHVSQREAELERMVGELSGTAAELRAGFEREFAAMQEQLAAQVSAERERYMRELGAMEGRVDELRHQLVRAAGSLQAELEAEQAARQQAEQALAGEQSTVTRLSAALERMHPASPAGQAEASRPAAADPPEATEDHAQMPRSTVAEPPEPADPQAEALAERRRQEMALALAEAVQRLRARVAARPEGESESAGAHVTLDASSGPQRSGGPAADSIPGVGVDPEPGTAERAEDPDVAASRGPIPASDAASAHAANEDADPASDDAMVTDQAHASVADGSLLDATPPTSTPSVGDRVRRGGLLLGLLRRARRGQPANARAQPAKRAKRAAAGPAPAASPMAVDAARPELALPVALEPPVDARPLELGSVQSGARAPSPWLEPALRRVAVERDAQLASDLIVELLPALGLHLDRPAAFGVRLGDTRLYVVRAGARRPANVSDVAEGDSPAGLEFTLSGTPADLSALVASSGVRRLEGVHVSGSHRRARRVVRARTAPLSLTELANAEVRVWPGLLLLALAEGIDPSWTEGERFVLAWAIQGTPGAVLYVAVSGGRPPEVSHRAPAPPVAAVYLTERAFLRLMAGTSAAEESVLVRGDEESVRRFIAWAFRAQA